MCNGSLFSYIEVNTLKSNTLSLSLSHLIYYKCDVIFDSRKKSSQRCRWLNSNKNTLEKLNKIWKFFYYLLIIIKKKISFSLSILNFKTMPKIFTGREKNVSRFQFFSLFRSLLWTDFIESTLKKILIFFLLLFLDFPYYTGHFRYHFYWVFFLFFLGGWNKIEIFFPFFQSLFITWENKNNRLPVDF